MNLFIFNIFFFNFILCFGFPIEDRKGDEWTYKPTIDYVCNFLGCCGSHISNPCSPEYWKYINFNTLERCQRMQQSPINIEINSSYVELDTPILFEIMNCNGTIILKNNTWEIDFTDQIKCSVKTFGNTTWFLQNFHIHSAEHTIDGEYMPLEIHYVHKNIENRVMVISLLVSGTSRAIYNPMLQIFEKNPNNSLENISPYALITQESTPYWYYKGSLTTPPCQINNDTYVEWFIIKDYLEIHHEQVYFFTEYLKKISKSYKGRVSRPIQDIHQDTQIFSYR